MTLVRRRLVRWFAVVVITVTLFVLLSSFTINQKNEVSRKDMSEELMKFVNNYLKFSDTEQMITEPIKNSAYVEKETENELSKEDSKGIANEIKELKKNLNKDTNKA